MCVCIYIYICIYIPICENTACASCYSCCPYKYIYTYCIYSSKSSCIPQKTGANHRCQALPSPQRSSDHYGVIPEIPGSCPGNPGILQFARVH